MRFGIILSGLSLILSTQAVLQAQGTPGVMTGWYNGDWQTGIPGISNWYLTSTDFARVYDDFVVPAGGWTIAGVYSYNGMTSTITEASWEIRSGVSAGNGGTLVASGIARATQTLVKVLSDTEANYLIEVDGLNVTLAPGTYWLSVAPVTGSEESYINPTLGANAIGNPPGTDGKAYFNSPVVFPQNGPFTLAQATGTGGTAGDFSMGVLIPVPGVPSIWTVVNAASFQAGPISPGEIVTIGGTAFGPVAPAYLMLDQNGNVATSLAGVQVWFGGTPTPLVYVSGSQINAVVPYELTGLLNSSVQVKAGSQSSYPFQVAMVAAVPALFTANGSGTGPAAALNSDNSYNAPNHPAAKGSYVTLFLTGEGQTSPAGVTGKVTRVSATPPLTPQPLLPVTVTIGSQNATVLFYGEAPDTVAGAMQLDVLIPANAPSGNLPITVYVGSTGTQGNVTISVQ